MLADTVVLSSTAGAAERQGFTLGEYVLAGEHEGWPYYTQQDTEGNGPSFLYHEGGNWKASYTLGGSDTGLKNNKTSPHPPLDQWIFYDGKKWRDDDTSLTLEFAALSPICRMVRVAGEGDVVKVHGDSLGVYRSEYI